MADPRSPDLLVEVARARTSAALFDLAACSPVGAGVLTFVGPDARRFCNGMFTNNIRNLPVGRANQNAMVDDKARIQGLHDLACLADSADVGGYFRATLEGVATADFIARYEKYIIFDDLELADISEDWRVLSLQGPDATRILEQAGVPIPSAEGDVLPLGDDPTGATITRRARSVAGGFDLCVPAAETSEWAARLALPYADAATLERLRVEAGLVRWPVDMGERALPHEMRAVPRMCNFEKGCYIGQEVLNRIHSIGHVNRELRKLRLAADVKTLPARGDKLFHGEKEVGHITSAVLSLKLNCIAMLGYVRRDANTIGTELNLRSSSGESVATIIS